VLAVSIALSRLPARLADVLSAPLIRLTVGDITKLGFRKLPFGPITQVETTSRVPLIDIGTLRLVREGRIEVLGGVHSFGLGDQEVTFDDGSSRHFHAIVLATGYRPGLERFLEMPQRSFEAGAPLRSAIKAPGDAGLYFCGFRVSSTGMLRDIGIEARWIAKDIARLA